MKIPQKVKILFSSFIVFLVLACGAAVIRAEGLKVKGICHTGAPGEVSTEISPGGSLKLGLLLDSGDGAVASVKWTVTDAAGNDMTKDSLDDPASQTPVFSAKTGGKVLLVRAEVSNAAGIKSGAQLFISVNAPDNHPPRASIYFKGFKSDGGISLPVHFKCNAYDEDSDKISYCWDFDASNGVDPGKCDSTDQQLDKNLLGDVTREITCIVSDGKGGVGFDRRTFSPGRVSGAAPSAEKDQSPAITSFVVDLSKTDVEKTVVLSAQADDPDGDEVDMKWTVSGGTLDQEDSPIAVWKLPEGSGRQSATFDVSDGTAPVEEHSVRFNIEEEAGTEHPGAVSEGREIKVGVLPVFIAADPKGKRVFVSDSGSDEVSIIDAVGEEVTRVIKTERQPWGITYDEKSGKVFVANKEYGTINVFNADGSGQDRITTGTSAGPVDVAVDTAHDVFYAINGGSPNGKLIYLSAVSGAVGGEIPMGSAPASMAFNKETRMIYVADSVDNSVTVIDGWKNEVAANIPLGSSPAYIEVNEKTNTIYVTCPDAGTVAVIDGNSNTLAHTVNIGFVQPKGIGIDEDNNLIFTADNVSGAVTEIDGVRNIKIKDIPVGDDPWDVAVIPGLRRLYVTMRAEGAVAVVEGY